VGPTSTVSLLIIITSGNFALLTDLNDFPLGLWGGGDVTGADNVCVYRNAATGQYTVTASSANAAGGVFRLSDAGVNFVPYQVGWTDVTGSNFAASTCVGGGGPCAGSGVASAVQTGANPTSTNCGGATNATLSLSILGANLTAVPGGAYTDTLTILISPM
jgi:hypothetical protein